ncbi:hypothetical protein M902_2054 [Bacteriovorax sp. BAL6_X]|uniref:hypothetical protein n=1 Tax=Bacteriovorax sp. BAL6_X TaxID=1201290 RepID=UPI0003868CCD|nr:hypothetical protein [Bacteriovorax sp. BAL6_X]EPZ51948.1 hypothetical protein M902_2054 [Bacteriovorax sp. BAL6_X]
MKTLQEFRPSHKNVISNGKAKKVRVARKVRKGKKGSSSFTPSGNLTNIALALCAVLMGFGQYKKSSEVAKLKEANASLTKEITALQMNSMKYMADKKIQEISKETYKSKVAHVDSLNAIIAKSKVELAKANLEIDKLKNLKMSELQYKTKLAQIENEYQKRLDAHNRASTETITRMGRKMMAEVDSTKTREPASATRHVVQFKGSKPVNARVLTNQKTTIESDEWRSNNMEL